MKYIYNKKNPTIRRYVDENDPDFVMPDTYTEKEPLGLKFYPELPVQKIDNVGNWKLGDKVYSEDATVLKNMLYIPALEIKRALQNMPNKDNEDDKTAWDDLQGIFDDYPDLKEEWYIATNGLINLNDPNVTTALGIILIDVDDVKRKILEIRGI
jgi:hypothetical protein